MNNETKVPITGDINDIMAYEAGELNDKEITQLFQKLIDSGMAWQLQGHYGRMAAMLIETGHCRPAGRRK